MIGVTSNRRTAVCDINFFLPGDAQPYVRHNLANEKGATLQAFAPWDVYSLCNARAC